MGKEWRSQWATALLGEKGELAWPHRGKRDPGSERQEPSRALGEVCLWPQGLAMYFASPEAAWDDLGSWIGSSRGGRRGSRGSRVGGGGASLTYHCSSPCPERLRQGGARAKSDELASGNDAHYRVSPKNACIYHEGPSGGGVPGLLWPRLGPGYGQGAGLGLAHSIEQGTQTSARRISQVPS